MRVGCWVSGKERNPTDNSSAMTSPQGTQESNGHVTKLWSYEPQLPPPPNNMPKILSLVHAHLLPPSPSPVVPPYFSFLSTLWSSSPHWGHKRKGWENGEEEMVGVSFLVRNLASTFSAARVCVPQRENKATQPRPRVPPARSPHRGRSDGRGTGTGNIFNA